MNDWFRIKKYPHIGLPLVESDRLWVEKYVSNRENVAKHAFFPFIHRTMLTRKFRKEYDESDEITNEGMRKKSEKNREIFYANHIDSNIFSYYTTEIREFYEKELVRRNLSDSVTAYRNILHPKKQRGMNNVDFAEEVFSFIRRQKTPVLVATTFDIKSFFDNLNHLRLKYAWASLLRLERLPSDHYNIFKAITKFSFIDIKSLFEVVKNDLIKYGKSGAVERVAVKHIENLRNQEIVAFCTTKELMSKIRPSGIIKANKFLKNTDGTLSKREKGIPQGSPISSILANLYLMDFDSKIAEAVKACGGLYRRYSDDIVVVTPESSGERLCNLVLNTIKEYDLEIQESKTNSYKFHCSPQGYVCGKILPNGNLNMGRRFTYLGFEFNGRFTYLKSSSLSSFYRRMKHSVRRGAFYAKFSKYKDKEGRGEIFRRRLFKKFSYLGAKRKMKWEFNKTEGKWRKSYRHEWGNYLTYANMAHFNMKNSKIRAQLRNHWFILNDFIKKNIR